MGGSSARCLPPPIEPDSVTGVIFFSPIFYGGGCGHATIAVATMLVETGVIPGPLPVEFNIDTPVGTVTARVNGSGDEVESVSFRNVASVLFKAEQDLDVPGIGTVKLDLCYGGNLYGYVWAPDLGVRVRAENLEDLLALGRRVVAAMDEQVSLDELPHQITPRIGAVMFRDEPEHPDADMKNILMGRRQFDRSPCGTGTSGWLAALHARGEIAVGDGFVNESITGGMFRGKVLETTSLGELDAIVPEITGKAYITGFHDFVVDPRDPYPHGFEIGQSAT
jgi:proline racemase